MNHNYEKNIKLDYLVTFTKNFNLTMGVWIAFLGVVKGFSLTQIGLLEGVFHIASLTSEVPTGMFADIIGRKQSRIVSILIYLVYLIIMIFSQSFIVITIGLILCGISYTFESGSGEALVYDSLKEMNQTSRYKRILGNKEIIFQFTSSIALVLGGYLATVNYHYNFYFTGIVMVLVLIPLFLMKETTIQKKQESISFKNRFKEHFIESFKTVIENKTLLFLIIAGGILAAPITTIFFYLQIYLPDLGFTMFHVGILLAFHALFGTLGGLFAPYLEKRFKSKLILYIIPLFMIISYFLIQVDSIIFIPFVFLGFLDSVFYVVLNDYINKLAPSDKRATILSFHSFSFSFIMILLFPLVGLLGDLFTLKISFFVLGILVVMCYFMLLYQLRNNPNILLNEGEEDVSN
jgi:MFS family permease